MTQFSMKRRKSDRQYVWEYMRRNRLFRVEDLLPLVDMGTESLRKYFGQLERAGYIRARKINGKVPKRFTERSYGLVKNTGILCPVWVDKQKRLYDRNNQELQIRDPSMTLPVEVKKRGKMKPIKPIEYDKGRIVRLLEDEDLDLLQLAERSGVSNGRFSIAIAKLKEEGIIEEKGKRMGVPVYTLTRRANAS